MPDDTRESYLERLKAWAADHGLEIRTVAATQREPTHLVSVCHPDRVGGALVLRESSDSIETAAMYLWNTLYELGARGVGRDE
jgi:hypothetical protein